MKRPSMTTEPALMSLTSVAQAIAEKKRLSSREATKILSRPDCAVAAPSQRVHGDRNGGGACRSRWPPTRRWQQVVLAARCTVCRWRTMDMYYDAGKVWTCGFENPPRFCPDHDLDGTAAAEGTPAPSGSARCRWWSSPMARPATIRITGRSIIPLRSITSPAARRRDRARRSQHG